jgi:hypothetical protein
LFEFKRNSTPAAVMTVSDRYIVVMNPDDDIQLIIYDFISKQRVSRQPAILCHPYFLPDGHLLARGDGSLAKYRLKDGELTTVWTCDGLENINEVCADADGLIYGSTHSSKRLVYIISPKGKFSVYITH